MDKKRSISYVLALLTGVSAVNALVTGGPSGTDILNGFLTAGKYLSQFLQHEEGVYIITLVFFFIIFFAVYSSVAKKLTIFEGTGGLGLNAAGKMFCTAATGLTCTAIFAFRQNVVAALNQILAPFGGLGILLLAFVCALLVWKSMGDEHFLWFGRAGTALLCFLIALIFFAWMTQNTDVTATGIFLLVIFIIVTLLSSSWKRFHRKPLTEHDVENMESRLRNEEHHDQRDRANADLEQHAESQLQNADAARAAREQREANEAKGLHEHLFEALNEGNQQKAEQYYNLMWQGLQFLMARYEADLPEEEQELLKDIKLKSRYKRDRIRHEMEVRDQIRIDDTLHKHKVALTGELINSFNELKREEKADKILENLKRSIEHQQSKVKDLSVTCVELSRRIITKIKEETQALIQLRNAGAPAERKRSLVDIKKIEEELTGLVNAHIAALGEKFRYRGELAESLRRKRWLEERLTQRKEILIQDLERERADLQKAWYAAAA